MKAATKALVAAVSGAWREPLQYAVNYLAQSVLELEICHANQDTGKIDDPDIREEVRELRAWLKRARALL